MPGWNFADVFECIAGTLPDSTAVAHGDREVTWRGFDTRADAIAAALTAAGLRAGAAVALHAFNCPEYLEATYAAFKARMAPMNTNYRYVGSELSALWLDARVEAVVFSASLADRIEPVRSEVPSVKLWLAINDGIAECPIWATPYDSVATSPPVAPAAISPPRSGDDLLLLYTGGTTGLPKGVMWRQDDLYSLFSERGWRDPAEQDLSAVRSRVVTKTPPVWLVASPLMHGTGWFCALQALCRGGTVVTLPGQSFDVELLLDTMVARAATALTIVGDAFSRPIIDALQASPTRWNLGALGLVYSSGVTWSDAVKRQLLEHCPHAMLVDILSSSEAIGLGQSVMRAGGSAPTSRFSVGERARVIGDDGADVVAGSGIVGRLAVAGRVPLGYFNDPKKTAQTFPVLGGVRYSVPGDMATVESDGTITLLGRGSLCINTGGEKVYPEEVEACIRDYPGVADVVVVGVPDARWGEIVCAAMVADAVSTDDLVDHVRQRLAPYKVPRLVQFFESLDRQANGKADYRAIRGLCSERSTSMQTRRLS